MNQPLVSVVIPSYNRFDFLINAIKSVTNQTYPNVEIIVINDGSTQKEYYEKDFDSSVKLINLEKNQKSIHGYGPGNIRNFGIDNSEGKYIAFLDDDDYWFPNKLETQVAILQENKLGISSSEALIGNGIYNNEMKYKRFLQDYYYKKIKKIYLPNYLTSLFRQFIFQDMWDEKFLRKHNCMITSSVIMEKSILDKINGFRNLPSNADWDCWRAAIQFSNSFFCKEPLLYYDNNHGSGREYKK
tara:strand:- start:260 stop:988 length:729 start_codon:yes stop_codon:yes gene_type:complete